jgi:hypothetical protein
MNLNRDHFTQQGLHMNAAGKELNAQKTVNNIRRTLTKQMICPFILKWKDNSKDISQEEKVVEEKSDCMLEREETGGRSSGKLRKQPVTRNYDVFYGQ